MDRPFLLRQTETVQCLRNVSMIVDSLAHFNRDVEFAAHSLGIPTIPSDDDHDDDAGD